MMDVLKHCAAELSRLLHSCNEKLPGESLREGIVELAGKYRSGDFELYPLSVLLDLDKVYFLARLESRKSLIVTTRDTSTSDLPPEIAESQEIDSEDGGPKLHVCPCANANALYLQGRFSHLMPCVNTGTRGFGAGDRLGLSTPGHVRALSSSRLFPVFAQQSIREMERTQRTPADVMASAVWGLMQEGYTAKWGSDADHLKTVEEVEYVCKLPWTMYTLDPSNVMHRCESLDDDKLKTLFFSLPWKDLHSSPDGLIASYTKINRTLSDRFGLHSASISFRERNVIECAVKYSTAISLCIQLAQAIEASAEHEYELEVSFDETDTPTTPLEHFFIASELQRLDIPVRSLALRLPGDFEKGTDYKGNIQEFETAFAAHCAIRDSFNLYRISIHSGSDKFRVYPIMSKHAGESLHVKTAGTTYLEALRVIARRDRGLFRELLDFSYGRYDEDKYSYHVSANIGDVPTPDRIDESDYESLLDNDDYRQILHVTFGSVLTSAGEHDFKNRICQTLSAHEEDFYQALEKHFKKHLDRLNWG